MKITKHDGFNLALAIFPLIIIGFFYDQLPSQVPLHWGFDSQVRYGAKNSVWLLGALPIVFTILTIFLPLIDPRRKNYAKFSRQYRALITFVNLFILIFLGFLLLEITYPGQISINRLVPIMLGILFIFIGNIMPKFKSNFYLGIKTPWTLSSDDVWYKTHRLAGILWVVGGVLIILSAFILDEKSIAMAEVGIILLIVVIPSVMSFFWFKQLKGNI